MRRNMPHDGIPFEVPEPDLWAERLGSVLAVIYLIFNEGYSASSGEAPIRSELCREAIRLGVEMIEAPHPILAKDAVHCVGEAVAFEKSS